jgi:hypothetical protein
MEVKLGYSMKFYCLVYVCMHACTFKNYFFTKRTLSFASSN